MWTPATRRQHSRDGLRYETDLTDAEWALIEPFMPKPNQRGRPRAWPLREIVNAIFYVDRTGISVRALRLYTHSRANSNSAGRAIASAWSARKTE